MPDTVPPSELLHDVYRTGERMRAALDADELDVFFECMEARTSLIAQLDSRDAPSPRPPRWESLATQLQRQHRQLVTAVEHQRQRIDEALGQRQRFQQARAGYDTAGPAPQQVLNQHVRG